VRSCRILQAALLGATLAALLAPGAAAAKPSPQELSRQLSAASQQLETVIEQYDATQVRLSANEARRALLVGQMAPVQTAMDQLERQIGRYSASLYEHLDGAPVTALIAAGSPRTLLDQLTILAHLSWAARRDVGALTTVVRQYEQQQDQLDVILAQQRVQRADLTAKRAQIETQIAALSRLRYTLYGGRLPYLPRDHYVPPYLPGPGGIAVRYAYAQLGRPYRYGADGPASFDCSGLTMAAWRAAGVDLPHSSSMQWAQVAHVPRTDLEPGDLVFYYGNLHHVGIYIGGDRIIHAPTVGQDVEITRIDNAPIYGYGRPRG
jgi:cell wall-associated NlpC family hydrolase